MKFKASSPGRICLFGEHQDFLGLPVISMAMNLRFEIQAVPRKDRLYVIYMPDINEKIELIPSENLSYRSDRDYLVSSINVLKRKFKLSFDRGYQFTFTSRIPINSGCGSSSSMVVTWIASLLYLHGVKVDPVELGELAFEAEVLEFGESGGKMDQYTAAIGGSLFLDFKNGIYERLGAVPHGFVLGDSLQPKSTLEILKRSRSAAEEGFRNLKKLLPEFDIRQTSIEEVRPYLSELPEFQRKVVYAQLVDRDLLVEGYKMFKSGVVDEKRLGHLLLTHHRMLRDGLGVSTPKIEKMLDAAIRAGALGGKINGSGGGGTMFAYAPGKEEEVARAIEEAGGRAYIISMDRGTAVEPQ